MVTLNYKLLLLGENLYVMKVFKYIVEMLCVSLIDFPNQMAKVSILMTWGGDENGAETNGTKWYHIYFHIFSEAEKNTETPETNIKKDTSGNRHGTNTV
jgi:hypothetical protein